MVAVKESSALRALRVFDGALRERLWSLQDQYAAASKRWLQSKAEHCQLLEALWADKYDVGSARAVLARLETLQALMRAAHEAEAFAVERAEAERSTDLFVSEGLTVTSTQIAMNEGAQEIEEPLDDNDRARIRARRRNQ